VSILGLRCFTASPEGRIAMTGLSSLKMATLISALVAGLALGCSGDDNVGGATGGGDLSFLKTLSVARCGTR
jgi:hypothetical protein